MEVKSLISIVGPTAIGKTKLAIGVAKHFKTEIISADSRQFYQEMNIGTAVPSAAELAVVPHHFIQHKSIVDEYSVGEYERDAIALLEALFNKYNVVVLVGGSGLYVDAVTKGLDDFPKIDPKIRSELNDVLKKKGIKALQDQLKQLDRDYHNKVDLDNPHRLVRALEVCIGSGKPYSSFLDRKENKRPFNTVTVGITADREIVYGRINQRVDRMVEQGLIDEAKSLIGYRELNALQTVGYKELFRYFDGECGLESAIGEIKKNTRRFAKRQLTWFKKNPDTVWVDYTTEIADVVPLIENEMANGK